ncbi:hypothetical protein PR048_001898, partial [Dryococelus australis]
MYSFIFMISEGVAWLYRLNKEELGNLLSDCDQSFPAEATMEFLRRQAVRIVLGTRATPGGGGGKAGLSVSNSPSFASKLLFQSLESIPQLTLGELYAVLLIFIAVFKIIDLHLCGDLTHLTKEVS